MNKKTHHHKINYPKQKKKKASERIQASPLQDFPTPPLTELKWKQD